MTLVLIACAVLAVGVVLVWLTEGEIESVGDLLSGLIGLVGFVALAARLAAVLARSAAAPRRR